MCIPVGVSMSITSIETHTRHATPAPPPPTHGTHTHTSDSMRYTHLYDVLCPFVCLFHLRSQSPHLYISIY